MPPPANWCLVACCRLLSCLGSRRSTPRPRPHPSRRPRPQPLPRVPRRPALPGAHRGSTAESQRSGTGLRRSSLPALWPGGRRPVQRQRVGSRRAASGLTWQLVRQLGEPGRPPTRQLRCQQQTGLTWVVGEQQQQQQEGSQGRWPQGGWPQGRQLQQRGVPLEGVRQGRQLRPRSCGFQRLCLWPLTTSRSWCGTACCGNPGRQRTCRWVGVGEGRVKRKQSSVQGLRNLWRWYGEGQRRGG